MHRTEQLLSTKFYIPSVRSDFISRPRLLQQLDDGLYRKLTLISAPAGSGKTTLVSEWIATHKPSVAWLSLDEGDNDTTRFLMYFVKALQKIEVGLGQGVLAMLKSAQQPPIESILTNLINEASTIKNNSILVLDDYHVVDSQNVDDALSFLIEHLPIHIHLVITTREDPNLPLARLRANDQLTELRITDLRFTSSEITKFFNDMMGLGLSTEEVNALENRTEGWIAGLQLAGLSMQGRKNIPEFISSFTGNHRYIVDYLVEEVLQNQSEKTRNFLLQTSILNRLNHKLCDVVTQRNDSNSLLNYLGRANLFIVPLDNNRTWYRYHHLFGDVLRAHLLQEYPEQVPELYKRASTWCEKNGLFSESIHYSLTAKDYENAARLIEQIWSKMDKNRQSVQWLEWAKRLPEDVTRNRPVLNIGYAWALLDRGELESGEARINEAEKCLEKHKTEIAIADKEEFRFLPATIATARAYHALAVGNVSKTVSFARQALDILPENEYLRQGTPASLLSLASWTDGNLELADQALVNAMESYKKAGNILYTITGAYAIADIRMTLGRLRQAFEVCQQALQLAEGEPDFVRWGMVDVYSSLSELYREMNDFEAAQYHLATGEEFGKKSQVPRWRYRWCLAQARLQESQGNYDEALNLLDEAEANYRRGPMPDVRPVSTLKTRIAIKQNKLNKAMDWVKEQGISSDDDLFFLREFDHITLARVLLAEYRQNPTDKLFRSTIGLLERLLKMAESGSRMGNVIEIRILQALLYEAQNDIPRALEFLEHTLKHAELEEYIRIFVDEGTPMLHLLSKVNIQKPYVNVLLEAFDEIESNPSSDQSLIDPLSDREQEILALIANGLKNKEIAEQMVISLNTVLYHTKNIYNKLGVNKRTQAVLKAQELKLL